jgi:hypothetical protein
LNCQEYFQADIEGVSLPELARVWEGENVEVIM